jgi:hypothetical protein
VNALLRRLYASLFVLLCTYQEMRVPFMSTYHLPDDATEDELLEMVAERRQLAMEQRERATASTRWPVAYAIFRRLDNEHDAWHGYGSDIAELNN